MKNLKYILILSCLWLTACTQDNDFLPRETEKATVHLNLHCASIEVDTRSTTPQDPETDNPMYSLHLLHYNAEGQLIKEDTQYKDFLDTANLTYEWSPTLTIKGGNETVCLVANMNDKEEAPKEWPERLAELKEACATLKIDDNGLIKKKEMYMFGYYEGPLTPGQNINIMMGRMAATLKFVISFPNKDNRYRITKIEIQKPSRKTYYFPHGSEAGNFPTNITETFTNTNDNDFGNGLNSELTYYYQVGENINPAEDNRTTVVITAQKGTESRLGWWYADSKTYTVVLGCDAPGTPNRNYSLYRNNNYTFNIALK